jgi:hypothetical protein
MQLKDYSSYSDCKIYGTASLNSCIAQENGNKTYYFGVYTFSYNNETYNFINNTYYSKESKVPEQVSIRYNAFTSSDDMKVRVRYDRTTAIPFIYAALVAFLFGIYLIYRSAYKQALLLEQSKRSVKDIDNEIDKELEAAGIPNPVSRDLADVVESTANEESDKETDEEESVRKSIYNTIKMKGFEDD